MTVKLLIGDNREKIKEIEDRSIDCIVTSPPYWGLRDYETPLLIFDGNPNCNHIWEDNTCIRNNDKTADEKQKTNKEGVGKDTPIENVFCQKCGAWKGQLGLEPTPELFIKHLADIFDVIKPKIKDTGNCFINLGDTYSANRGYQVDGSQPSIEMSAKNCGVSMKSLCMIPQRFAWEMIQRGWILRNEIIWYKPNHMPESVTDRLTKAHEVIWHFVKQEKYYYDLDSIREPHKNESMKRALRGRSSNSKYADNDELPEKVHANTMSQERPYVGYANMEKNVENGETTLHPNGKNPGDVFSISTQAYSKAHFATFPLKLVEKPILAGCPIDGWVLDPFAGSGTVGEFCTSAHRNAVLIELNEEYEELIVDRNNLKEIPLSKFFSYMK